MHVLEFNLTTGGAAGPEDDGFAALHIADLTSDLCGGAHQSLPFFNADCEEFTVSDFRFYRDIV